MQCTSCRKQPGNITYNGKCEDCYIDGIFPGSERKQAYWDSMRDRRVPRYDDRHRRNLKEKEMAIDHPDDNPE